MGRGQVERGGETGRLDWSVGCLRNRAGDSDWIGQFWWWWLVAGVCDIHSWAGYRAGLDTEVGEIGAGCWVDWFGSEARTSAAAR